MEIKYWRLRTKAESAFVLNKTMTWNGIENDKKEEEERVRDNEKQSYL